MAAINLTPRTGAGPVLLGSSRAQAREALSAVGFPLEDSRGPVDYFCESSIQTECSPEGRVWYIGFSYHERLTVQYKGKNVFALAAPDLFALIAKSESSGKHTYESCEYCFPDQIVTLWDADEQYDRLGNESNPVWAVVGIGDPDYAAAIAAIRR